MLPVVVVEAFGSFTQTELRPTTETHSGGNALAMLLFVVLGLVIAEVNEAFRGVVCEAFAAELVDCVLVFMRLLLKDG